MSAKISATFLRAALGPIQYAAGLITSNKVLQGMEELGADGLLAGLRRGVTDIAALSGIASAEIERALPMTQVEEVSQRLASSQPAAVAAWKLHAGPFGFMDVITALTIDGRKPEIGLCIERVAKKVSADPELSKPLLVLATDVTAWEEIIVRCKHVLDDRDWLAKAYAKKRLVRVLTASVPIAVIVASLGLILTVKLSRDRIDRALAVSDPCAAVIPTSDAHFASKEQDKTYAAAQARCEATALAEKRAKEAEAAQREAERAAAARKAARLDGCAKLAASVTDGSFSGAVAGVDLDAPTARLLGRIAMKKLEPEDVGPTDLVLPCADTPSAVAIADSFGAALAPDVTLWARHSDPSPMAQKALESRKDSLPPTAIIGLAEGAERTAKEGLTSGKPDIMARAKRLCTMARALGTPGGGSCVAVEKL